jgi:hypothetical protein
MEKISYRLPSRTVAYSANGQTSVVIIHFIT